MFNYYNIIIYKKDRCVITKKNRIFLLKILHRNIYAIYNNHLLGKDLYTTAKKITYAKLRLVRYFKYL